VAGWPFFFLPHVDRMLEALQLQRTDPATGHNLLEVPRLEFHPGQRVGIQGPSGSGKSLLLRALAWLDRLNRGEIRYRGRRIHHDALPDYRRRVVYLHQAASLDGPNVEGDLRSPFRLRIHHRTHYDRGQALELLARLDRNQAFLDKSTRDLSGGERQITALVRALLLEPDILLLDEPTAALDPAAARRVEDMVCEWVDEAADRRAILWVSHDQGQTGRLATRTLHIEAGRVKE
jgi:putative ABC transport system ATP-binding protein